MSSYLDEAFSEYIIRKHGDKWPSEFIAIVRDKDHNDHNRFVNQVRDIKEKLSTNRYVTCPISIGSSYQDLTLSFDELESAAEQITSEIAEKCYKVVKDCGKLDADFPIVLVGGSSNSPIIKDAIAKKFPKQAQSNRIFVREPSTAVMNGCTYYARNKEISSWVNYAYAIECYDDERGKQVLTVEIPAGVRLPYARESHFSTRHDNQSSVDFRIFEVPDITEDDDNIVDINDGIFKDINVVHSFNRPVPKGTGVTCRMELNESGVLIVSITDDGITGGRTYKTYGIGIKADPEAPQGADNS